MAQRNVRAGGSKKLYRGRMRAATPQAGATADRPTRGFVGDDYFDTDLNKPIWVSAADAADGNPVGGTITEWRDAAGVDVT